MRSLIFNMDDLSFKPISDGKLPILADQTSAGTSVVQLHHAITEDDCVNISPYPMLCSAAQTLHFRDVISGLGSNSVIIELYAGLGGNVLSVENQIPEGAEYHLIEPLWIRPTSMALGGWSGYGALKWMEQIDLNHHISGYVDLQRYALDRLQPIPAVRIWPYEPSVLTFWKGDIDLLVCNLPFTTHDPFDDASRYFDMLRPGGKAVGFNYHIYPSGQRLAHRLSAAKRSRIDMSEGFWSIPKT